MVHTTDEAAMLRQQRFAEAFGGQVVMNIDG